MKIIAYFTGTDNPAANRRAVLAAAGILVIILTIFLFLVSPKVSATEQPDTEESAPVLTNQLDSLLAENARLTEENARLSEEVTATEGERDALLEQIAATEAELERIRSELEAIRIANATAYVLRFRVERNLLFPKTSEILYFTRTVDKETFDRWTEGDVLEENIGFLTIPNDGTLHQWVVVLEEKYTKNTDA